MKRLKSIKETKYLADVGVPTDLTGSVGEVAPVLWVLEVHGRVAHPAHADVSIEETKEY